MKSSFRFWPLALTALCVAAAPPCVRAEEADEHASCHAELAAAEAEKAPAQALERDAEGLPVATIPSGEWSDVERRVQVGDADILIELENDGREPEPFEPKHWVEEIEALNTRVPHFELTHQSGETFSRDQLHGRVWVADFIFTRCAGPCPTLSAQMMFLRQMTAVDFENVDFVTFTVDPDFDTPEVLSNYAKRFDGSTGRWHLLTGAYETIENLAIEVFGVGVSKHGGHHDAERGIVLVDPIPETILHSRRFILVDERGRIRGYYDGTRPEEMPRLLRDLTELAKDAKLDEIREKELAAEASR
jgi:protein SCO1/2